MYVRRREIVQFPMCFPFPFSYNINEYESISRKGLRPLICMQKWLKLNLFLKVNYFPLFSRRLEETPNYIKHYNNRNVSDNISIYLCITREKVSETHDINIRYLYQNMENFPIKHIIYENLFFLLIYTAMYTLICMTKNGEI